MQSVQVNIDYPAKLSRGLLILKTLFGCLYVGIPHGICLAVLGFAGNIVMVLAWFAVLFTGKYPEGFFNFVLKIQNWGMRVSAYLLFLRDEYPPFSLDAQSPAAVTVAYPAKLSRGLLLLRLFFGMFYVGIPHGFCLAFRMIGFYVVLFVAWWAVLFTGKMPASMFSYLTGTLRWSINVGAYMMNLTDEYPPFTGKADGVAAGTGVSA